MKAIRSLMLIGCLLSIFVPQGIFALEIRNNTNYSFTKITLQTDTPKYKKFVHDFYEPINPGANIIFSPKQVSGDGMEYPSNTPLLAWAQAEAREIGKYKIEFESSAGLLIFNIDDLSLESELTLSERQPGEIFAGGEGNEQFELTVKTPGIAWSQIGLANWIL